LASSNGKGMISELAKTHEPTKESLHVFSPDDFPFASKEDFDQIQWPKKEEYQQLLDKYKEK
jgi:hypothetical protein